MNIAQQKAQSAAIRKWDEAGMLDWYGVFSYLPLARRFKDPQEARHWSDATRDFLFPSEMIQWRNAGFTAEEAAKWSKNWGLEMALERKRLGQSPRKVTSREMVTR